MSRVKLVLVLALTGLLIASVVGLSSIASKRPRAAIREPEPYAGMVPPDLPLGADGDADASPNPLLTR